MELTAREIAGATQGTVVAGRPEALASSFSIDSRRILAGGCFIAVQAARDGHDFVRDAFARGATIAIVQRDVSSPGPDATLVRVADQMTAAAALAREARARLTGAHVVGITGSAGKTATKDLTAAAIAPRRLVHASPGSFNNELGLPLTLLGAPPDTEVVITEMGARFSGNIAELADLARPDIGVVTNVGMAHAEHLGGPAGIARVKGELVEALPTDGLAVLNDDDAATPELARRAASRVIRVGRTARADVRVGRVTLDDQLRPHFRLETPWGGVDAILEMRGEHQALNAAMGVAVAAELGVPVIEAVAGLARVQSAPHRMTLERSPDGVLVLDDAYNSSPTSAAAALRALQQLRVDGRRVAVLGTMLELGPHTEAEHFAVGKLAAASHADLVVVVGDGASAIADGARQGGIETVEVDDVDGAAALVAERVQPGDAVLVKASHAVGLERLAASLSRGKVAR